MKHCAPPIFSGVVVLLLAAIASAQTPSLLFSFPCNGSGVCPDGYFPTALFESPDGNFYGAATGGGTGLNAQGTVFKFTPTGQLSLIYSFAEQPDGSLPNGAAPTDLIEGTDGFLYGTTLVDGANGLGTVFKLSKTGVIQDLHDFCAALTCSDGAYPAFIQQALDGKFYGATGPSGFPADVLFRISSTGTFKVLHTFDTKSQPDGGGAFGLLQAPGGIFYSATVAGAQNSPFNTVFSFNPTTSAYKILHGFTFPNYAASNLAQTASGELFGLKTNSLLYQISPAGKYRQIGALTSTQYLDGEILLASDGNLWGNFQGGDCSDQGMVFAATASGAVLHNIVFDCTTVGQQLGSMIQAADGKFYGVTLGTGSASPTSLANGTIWVLDAGLPKPSPVITNFAPASGKAGATILVQGDHLIGTTAVSFHGVKAAFKVFTVNYISATVPSGATTGTIAITNAGGTTTSTQSFTVQ